MSSTLKGTVYSPDEPDWWKHNVVPASITEDEMQHYDAPRSSPSPFLGGMQCKLFGHPIKIYRGGYTGIPHGKARATRGYFIAADICFCPRCFEDWLLNWRDK